LAALQPSPSAQAAQAEQVEPLRQVLVAMLLLVARHSLARSTSWVVEEEKAAILQLALLCLAMGTPRTSDS